MKKKNTLLKSAAFTRHGKAEQELNALNNLGKSNMNDDYVRDIRKGKSDFVKKYLLANPDDKDTWLKGRSPYSREKLKGARRDAWKASLKGVQNLKAINPFMGRSSKGQGEAALQNLIKTKGTDVTKIKADPKNKD